MASFEDGQEVTRRPLGGYGVDTEWGKARKSGNSDSCVEACALEAGGAVVGFALRDGQDPTGPELRTTPAGWGAFVADARAGSLDLPA
jgi:hypothetical protein